MIGFWGGLLRAETVKVTAGSGNGSVDELRKTRAELVVNVRTLAERFADPDTERMFNREDFNS